jgi:hypothetical protein
MTDASRRRFLRGALRGAAVAVALPPLELFWSRSARAACDSAFPKRFGLFYWGNGTYPDRWNPTNAGTGEDWALSETLSPLIDIKHKLTVVSGMTVRVDNVYPHTSGAAGILTGSPVLAVGSDTTFASATVDQVVAEAIGGDTLYRSLRTGASNNSGMSYNGPNSRNYPEVNPFTLYQALFGDTFHEPGDEVIIDPRLGLRQSVLDGVMGDIGALQAKVGAADKVRLEQHLDGIRELELRLARLQEAPASLAACLRPSTPLESYPDIDGRPQVSAISRAFADLLVMALACDQTRVFAHYVSDPVSNVLYPGISDGHHNLTHDEGGEQDEVNEIVTQIMDEFAYFCAALDAIPEGDKTLLDNCAFLATSDVSLGQTHSLEDFPLVIAGGACGYFKPDTHYRSASGDNASKVILSVLRSLDINASSWGTEDAEATDGLSDIEA